MTRPHGTAYAAIAVVLALGLTACGDSNGATSDPTPTTPPPSTTSSPTPSASPTPKTPQERAQTALERYLTISEKAQATGNLKDLKPLSKVATGNAYFNMRATVDTYSQNGIRLKGTVGHELSTPVMPNAGTANFTDCRDQSQSKVVDKSGTELETFDDQGNKMRYPDRYNVDYTVNLVPTKAGKKAWRVTAVNHRVESPC